MVEVVMKVLALLFILVSSVAHAELKSFTKRVTFPNEKPDQVIWKGIDLETGAIVDSPKFDQPGWHLSLRQGYVGTNKGSAVVFKTDDYGSVKSAPESGYEADAEYDPSGPAPKGWYNKTLMDWYDYHFFEGHLLSAKPLVYVIRTADGHYAKLQFTDYIKNGQAIRWEESTDFLGRKKWKQVAKKVDDEDNLVHVVIKVVFNTVAGDRNF